MSRFTIASMLNDVPPSHPECVDVSSDLRSLVLSVLMSPPTSALSSALSPIFNLKTVLFSSPATPTYTSNNSLLRSMRLCIPHHTLIETGCRRLHCSVPCRSAAGTAVELPSTVVDVEYPESGVDAPVGHLIPMDPATEQLPWADFAYSRGAPDGGSGKDDFFYTDLLVDANGKPVPCKKRHTTCQGIKACPFSDTQALAGPAHCHTSAMRKDIENRLVAARDTRQRLSSPQRDIFIKTAVYIMAVHTLGCRRPLQQETPRTGEELLEFKQQQSQREHFRRGYSMPPTCQGRIQHHEYPDPFDKDTTPCAYLSCEHYSRRTPHHWTNFGIQDGGYDVDYIAAHFLGNTDELRRIEQATAMQDLGPLAFCNTLRNYSSQTLHCPVDHRVEGRLAQVPLCHIDCDVKFQILFPVDLKQCPFVLVTSKGVYRHPIPLPEKTPRAAW
ncbi:hypothetical protein B0H13DRAFT_2335593 [Mycena leptocephala]|nr:hypothetical protein B0H13DRAFT_2335593 [Mycena leptocephala]